MDLRKPNFSKTFLFSVDLEDVRLGVKNGDSYKDRVPHNTNNYLNWLEKYNFKCTFFVTGHVAENHPNLIAEISHRGHEIACHTTKHIPLEQFTKDELLKDLEKNILLIKQAGIDNVKGFRAPSYSLTKNTEWVYPILYKLGFTYSSSVLPAKNPLYGWPQFGEDPRITDSGVIELPITVGKFGPLKVPSVGGIYFRVIPDFIINHMLKRRGSKDSPLIGFFHPYDIDAEQEKFMHGGINNNWFYNNLMYYNRSNVIPKLDNLVNKGYQVITYDDFVGQIKF